MVVLGSWTSCIQLTSPLIWLRRKFQEPYHSFTDLALLQLKVRYLSDFRRPTNASYHLEDGENGTCQVSIKYAGKNLREVPTANKSGVN